MRIVDEPYYNRPYEKYEKLGIEALTDTELLAILLRSGTVDCNVIELSYKLLCSNGKVPSLLSLYNMSYDELIKIKGIGKVKAIQIISLLELSKRISKEKYADSLKITSPKDIANYFMEEIRHNKQECFIAVLLDAKNKMIEHKTIFVGSLTSSIVHPREIYKLAIQKSANSILVMHNHPSGDPTPSKEDILITERLKKAGELIGIILIDHIIIGDKIYTSLKECGYL